MTKSEPAKSEPVGDPETPPCKEPSEQELEASARCDSGTFNSPGSYFHFVVRRSRDEQTYYAQALDAAEPVLFVGRSLEEAREGLRRAIEDLEDRYANKLDARYNRIEGRRVRRLGASPHRFGGRALEMVAWLALDDQDDQAAITAYMHWGPDQAFIDQLAFVLEKKKGLFGKDGAAKRKRRERDKEIYLTSRYTDHQGGPVVWVQAGDEAEAKEWDRTDGKRHEKHIIQHIADEGYGTVTVSTVRDVVRKCHKAKREYDET